LGLVEVRAFGHYKRVQDENGYLDRKEGKEIIGRRVRTHTQKLQFFT